MKILIILMIFLSYDLSAFQIKNKNGVTELICTFPKRLSDNSIIKNKKSIIINLYVSSNGSKWVYIKSSRKCRFKIKNKYITNDSMNYAVTASLNGLESIKSNAISVVYSPDGAPERPLGFWAK